jgi:hypothetical protein
MTDIPQLCSHSIFFFIICEKHCSEWEVNGINIAPFLKHAVHILLPRHKCWFRSITEGYFWKYLYIIIFMFSCRRGARGSIVGWGTMPQIGGSRVRLPDEVIGFFNWHNPSIRTMALGSTQPLTEMSTRNLSGEGGGRCVRLTSPPSVSRLASKWTNLDVVTTLRASTSCYRGSLPFFNYCLEDILEDECSL